MYQIANLCLKILSPDHFQAQIPWKTRDSMGFFVNKNTKKLHITSFFSSCLK